MKLGIVYKDEKIINHRSLLKVLVNPLLRFFGIQIATNFNTKTQILGTPVITICPRKPIKWNFKYERVHDYIKKERTII